MIYDFNLNTAAEQNLPPDKRLPNNKAFLKALLNPLQYAQNALFVTYYRGDLRQRINYNGSKLVLEYAINTYFGTTFNQPPMASVIRIANIDKVEVGFLIGLTDSHCSAIGLTEDYGNIYQLTAQDALSVGISLLYVNNFTVQFPSGSFTITSAFESKARNFINKYIPTGLHYTLTTY